MKKFLRNKLAAKTRSDHDELLFDPIFGGFSAASQRIQPIKSKPKVGNNEPCPCGSGKKYKKCCR